LFLLITENQHQIISTILSRTLMVKVPRITDDDLYYALEDRRNLSGTEANNVVKLVNGNYKDATRVIKQSDLEKFNQDNFIKWMRLCFKNNIGELSTFISTISRIGRERLKSFLIYSLRMIRECWLMNTGNNSLVKLNNSEIEFASNFNKFIDQQNGVILNRDLNEAIYHIERNANASILLMDLSLRIGKTLKSAS